MEVATMGVDRVEEPWAEKELPVVTVVEEVAATAEAVVASATATTVAAATEAAA